MANRTTLRVSTLNKRVVSGKPGKAREIKISELHEHVDRRRALLRPHAIARQVHLSDSGARRTVRAARVLRCKRSVDFIRICSRLYNPESHAQRGTPCAPAPSSLALVICAVGTVG